MKEGFCFGLGMMLGLMAPAVLILVVMAIAGGLVDWLARPEEDQTGITIKSRWVLQASHLSV